jgi:hypothetical protein
MWASSARGKMRQDLGRALGLPIRIVDRCGEPVMKHGEGWRGLSRFQRIENGPRFALLLVHAWHDGDEADIETIYASDLGPQTLAGDGDFIAPVRPFHRLLRCQRDADAQHDGADLLQEVAPVVDRLGFVDVQEPLSQRNK